MISNSWIFPNLIRSGAAVSHTIIAGAHDRTIVEPTQQRRTVPTSGWIGHPQFNPSNLNNDIAVVVFPTQPFTLNTYVSPIDLATDPSNLFVGEPVHVSGFGRYSDSSASASPVVRYTVKHVITNAHCQTFFGGIVIASTVCAIGETGINNSVCNGDSGGPLAARVDGRSLQVGVVNFGSAAGCEGGHPDGYARVSHFIDWIRTNAQL